MYRDKKLVFFLLNIATSIKLIEICNQMATTQHSQTFLRYKKRKSGMDANETSFKSRSNDTVIKIGHRSSFTINKAIKANTI